MSASATAESRVNISPREIGAFRVLGPRDVGGFVRDLEAAMAADGYPVRGLADHLTRHRADVPTGREAYPRRAPYDPPLWRG